MRDIINILWQDTNIGHGVVPPMIYVKGNFEFFEPIRFFV